jgi:lysophospholipase L1-like esterase
MRKFIYRSSLLLLLLGAFLLNGCAQAKAPSTTAQGGSGKQISALTYVAIGASDTFGIGTNDPYNQNWASDLSTLLGGNIHLVNLGIPGMTLHVALSAELPVALDAHPNLVTIWLAVNDVATNVPVESYSHDLDLMLGRLQAAAPHTRIEVGNIPDLTTLPYFASYDSYALSQRINAYNTAIVSIVEKHHVILVDLSGQKFNPQTHPDYLSSDGLHPSAAGYVVLAQLFYQALHQN